MIVLIKKVKNYKILVNDKFQLMTNALVNDQ